MAFGGWGDEALEFYEGLEADNTKTYWTRQKAVYDHKVLGPMTELLDELEPEFDELHEDVRAEILALTRLLQQFGPQLGRPRVDTLKGSRHANMKELRFSAADGEWRVAFAFDTKRKAILLVAGDKSGVGEKRFYRELIRKADDRFDAHLARLTKERK